MKKADVVIGETYMVKVSNRIVPVKITGESQYGGWDGINSVTNKAVWVKSAQRLRYRVTKEMQNISDELRRRVDLWAVVRDCCANKYGNCDKCHGLTPLRVCIRVCQIRAVSREKAELVARNWRDYDAKVVTVEEGQRVEANVKALRDAYRQAMYRIHAGPVENIGDELRRLHGDE